MSWYQHSLQFLVSEVGTDWGRRRVYLTRLASLIPVVQGQPKEGTRLTSMFTPWTLPLREVYGTLREPSSAFPRAENCC